MTNKEINEAVARKLGWKKDYYPNSGRSPNIKFWFKPDHKSPDNMPRYSKAIEAAWSILDFLVSQGYGVAVDKDDAEESKLVEEEYHGWHCNISGPGGFSDAFNDNPALAICLAFLKLPDK